MANDIEKIDIIIPNKSNIDDLFKCLDSLIKNVSTSINSIVRNMEMISILRAAEYIPILKLMTQSL